MNKYAPLTAGELSVAPIAPPQAKDDGEPVSPVPPNAPPPPQEHFELGSPTMRWEYRDASGATLMHVMRFDPPNKRKQFRPVTLQRKKSGELKWESKFPEPRPLYNRDKLAVSPEAPVVVCEGEKAADAATRLFPKSVCITSPGGSQSAGKADWSPATGRCVLIWPDADEPGGKYAQDVAAILHSLGCEISIIDATALASMSPEGGRREVPQGWDAADAVAEWTDQELLRRAIEDHTAPLVVNEGKLGDQRTDESEIARLASLSLLAYERERQAAADKLGCRVPMLDKMVAEKRQEKSAQRTVELCSDIEPCAEPVNVAELLNDILATIRRFIVCDDSTAIAAALWIAFTWIIDHVEVAPLAIITAPEKRCGKTQLLDVIGRLSRRSLFASNISPAAVFRVIETYSPTLVIDEADSFLKENEELRGVINSGHTRTTAYVMRCVGEDFEPKRFSTWGAKAIAGIGRQSETIMDRSIIFELRRKLSHEKVERLRHAEPGLFETLAGKLARFGADHGASLGRARPHLPEALNDRAQDNWEPLLAIADLAGGHWPDRARSAALGISATENKEISSGEQLLLAIKHAFEKEGASKLSREDLLKLLIDDEEGPWVTWNKGRPISGSQLRQKLSPYGIRTKKVRIDAHRTAQGFEREQFADAWARYLPPQITCGSPEQWNTGTCSESQVSGCPKTVPVEDKKWNNGTGECSDVPNAASECDALGTANGHKNEPCSGVPVRGPLHSKDMRRDRVAEGDGATLLWTDERL